MTALDLDNTIICYDEAFRSAAARLDCLPDGTPSRWGSGPSRAIARQFFCMQARLHARPILLLASKKT